jgi:hypothetical protein
MVTLPPDVSALLDALLAGLREALGDNLVGVYLGGSLALGDFDPGTSDVDILVVTERPLWDAEYGAISALHELIPADGNRYEVPYDVAYIERATLRRFAPGQTHVKIGHGEPLHRAEHRPNWVLERWTVREHGITVLGPDPKTLIDPIAPAEIREAVREELGERLRHWTDGSWPREEIAHRGAQAFEVETVCRALYTLANGGLPTKPQAVAWAQKMLPTRWHALIEWARANRGDGTRDEAKVEEAMGFLRWAVSEAEAADQQFTRP